MLVDDSFVISQPSRSYAVKPVVQLTSVLDPRLVSSSSGSNLSLKKTPFDGYQLSVYIDCLTASENQNQNDSVNCHFGFTSPHIGWG